MFRNMSTGQIYLQITQLTHCLASECLQCNVEMIESVICRSARTSRERTVYSCVS